MCLSTIVKQVLTTYRYHSQHRNPGGIHRRNACWREETTAVCLMTAAQRASETSFTSSSLQFVPAEEPTPPQRLLSTVQFNPTYNHHLKIKTILFSFPCTSVYRPLFLNVFFLRHFTSVIWRVRYKYKDQIISDPVVVLLKIYWI